MFPAASVSDALLFGFGMLTARFAHAPPMVPVAPGPRLRLVPPVAPAYCLCVASPAGGPLVLSEHSTLSAAVMAMGKVAATLECTLCVQYAGRVVAEVHSRG